MAFQQLSADAENRCDTNAFASALLSQAACQQSMGLYCEALERIAKAGLMITNGNHPPALRMRLEAALGGAYAATRRYSDGERLLRYSLESAAKLGDDQARLSILQNLGNLLAARTVPANEGAIENGRGSTLVFVPARVKSMDALQESVQCYNQAIELAQALTNRRTEIRLLLNKARAQMKAGNLTNAANTADKSVQVLRTLPDSQEKGFLAVSAARCLCDLDVLAAGNSAHRFESALGLLENAKQLAETAKDLRTASFAWGYLADIHHRRKELETALFCAEQALFRAQEFGDDDARFHWQWLVGSILRDQGQIERSITWYRQAVRTLQGRRGDFYTGSSMRGFGAAFHESLGDVFYQLADLLLQKAAESATGTETARGLTLEARQTIEMLKTVELESYFLGDDCTGLLRKQARVLDSSASDTTVIYYIPLPDRTEILVSLKDGLHRITSPATSRQVGSEAQKLRSALENPSSTNYLEPAQRLSQWLIQPVEPLLKKQGIENLLFVPDAALRGIPMSVLYDGKHFLLENYTIAVSPGLSILGVDSRFRKRSRALVCGISKPVQDHAELKYVPAELREIGALFKGNVLLDDQFQVARFQQALAGADASIVHIASHAHFGGDAQQSYILAFDDRVTLERLEELIEPCLLSSVPIELLTLSACQTAVGDERSALGLAGVAVKSGARSTLATLWSVNDESTERLMISFYQILKQPKIGKAKALQMAQRQLLLDKRFEHPFFWSPFVLIGDWF